MTEQNAESARVDARPVSRAKQAELDARNHFMADCGDHQMTVLHDDGLYRHLRFRSPGSLDRFEVVTWPGALTIDGGHGTWTFARMDDMFEFFRSSRGLTRINVGYWGEKLHGGLTSGNALTEEYDPDVYLAEVKTWLDDFIEGCDWPDEVTEDLRAEVASQLTDNWLDWTHEAGARELLERFQFTTARRRLRLDDVWEWDLRKPSTHFLWSCWAVAFAIDQYDQAQSTPPASTDGESDA